MYKHKGLIDSRQRSDFDMQVEVQTVDQYIVDTVKIIVWLKIVMNHN